MAHGAAVPKPITRYWYLWDGTWQTMQAIILWEDPAGLRLDSPRFQMIPANWAHDRYGDRTYTAEVYDVKHSRWIPLRTGDYVLRALTGECWPMAADVFDGTQDITERFGG